MNTLFDLSGKVAFVTGARTGLGRGMAMALAHAGADIAALGSTAMPETAEAVRQTGRRFLEIEADLTQKIDSKGIVESVVSALGGIDILVNNAGIIRRADLLDYTEKDWDDVIDVNLKSAFFLSQAAARHMVETRRPGRIINVASMLSYQGGIRVPAYTASKHGIAGLTKAMASELAPHGITVNAIAPGYMATDNTKALRNDPDRNSQISARIPMGRWGTPDDLATSVLFLTSPSSSYITGIVLPVDGGWLVR